MAVLLCGRLRGTWRAPAQQRVQGPLAVCHTVKPVGKPDAGNPHVRFDERGRETGRCRMAQATAPFLDSTNAASFGEMRFCRVAWHSIKRPDRVPIVFF